MKIPPRVFAPIVISEAKPYKTKPKYFKDTKAPFAKFHRSKDGQLAVRQYRESSAVLKGFLQKNSSDPARHSREGLQNPVAI